MTIRLLATYREFAPNTIVTLASGTETALLASGAATSDLSGGVPFNFKVPANAFASPRIVYGTDGVALGLADSTGALISTFTGITVPDAPTGVALTPFAGGVLATFTAPASNGGSAVTGYEVTLSTGQKQVGKETTIAINAPGGVAVTATVKAINGVGMSVASAASASATPTAFTPPAVPNAPTNVTLTAGDGKVTVSWTAPTSGAPLRNYLITLSNNRSASVAGNVTTVDIVTPNGIAVTATVRANNAQGAGPVSAASNSNTPTDIVANPYNQYQVEVQSATTGNAQRMAMGNSKRTSLLLANPATNSQAFEYAQTSNPNDNRNPPSSGYVSIAPGTYASLTGVDAVKQVYAKTLTANNKPITALTSTGLVATATIAGHGLSSGDVRAFEGNVPGGYNIRNVPVTVVDANTITFPLAAATAAATTLGYLYRADECLSVTTGETT